MEVPMVNGDKATKERQQVRERGQVTERQQNPTALKHILAPTDLTPDAQKAIDYAVALARDFGARLTLLHVYDSDFNCDYVFGANNYSDEDRYRAEAEKALRQLCAHYKETYTAIDHCYRVGSSLRGNRNCRGGIKLGPDHYLHPQLQLV